MNVSTRCNFKDFSVIWLSVTNSEEKAPLTCFPKLTPELKKELNLENGVEWSMSAFLFECDNKKALFDAGFFREDTKGIPERLKELKISPDDIDYIFITHKHWDHIDGLIGPDDSIIYKNAKIYISKEEYNGKIKRVHPGKEKLEEKFKKLYEKQIIQFDFGNPLPLGIEPIKAFGHTPGHTCYKKDNLLVIGDLIHAEKIQFNHPEICAFFDNDEEESIKSRKNILKYAKENKLILAGHHIPCDKSGMFWEFYKN